MTRTELYDKMLGLVDQVDPRLDDKIRQLSETWTWNPLKFREFLASMNLLSSVITSVVILVEKAQRELPVGTDTSGDAKLEISKAKMEMAVKWLNGRIDIPKMPEVFEAVMIRAFVSLVVSGLNRWGTDWLSKLRPDLDPAPA